MNPHHHRSSEPMSDAATTWPGSDASPGDNAVERQEFVQRWERIQVGFVDDPQKAVMEAEHLANQLLAQVRESLERERAAIVRAGRADGASTEDLRQCVKRYRMLVDRLLAMTS